LDEKISEKSNYLFDLSLGSLSFFEHLLTSIFAPSKFQEAEIWEATQNKRLAESTTLLNSNILEKLQDFVKTFKTFKNFQYNQKISKIRILMLNDAF